ncbi:MAG: hypothetical protein FWG87_08895 [Defluviitaleaceae bacterium]|nr:hypothetical protein [Defluviitaleaceae bacterium]
MKSKTSVEIKKNIKLKKDMEAKNANKLVKKSERKFILAIAARTFIALNISCFVILNFTFFYNCLLGGASISGYFNNLPTIIKFSLLGGVCIFVGICLSLFVIAMLINMKNKIKKLLLL